MDDRTRIRPRVGAESPWGIVQSADQFGEGVVFVSTSSHGGFWVSDEKLGSMPAQFARHGIGSRFHSGWDGWFEEDCEANAVVAAFPDMFPPDAVTAATEYLNR